MPPRVRLHKKSRETDSRPVPSNPAHSSARPECAPAYSCPRGWVLPQQCTGAVRKDWPWVRAISRNWQDISVAAGWQLREELTGRKSDFRLRTLDCTLKDSHHLNRKSKSESSICNPLESV